MLAVLQEARRAGHVLRRRLATSARTPSSSGDGTRGPRAGRAHVLPPRPRHGMPRWRVDRELAETQLAIAGAAGVTTRWCARRTPRAPTRWTTWAGRAVQAAGQNGYVTVFTTPTAGLAAARASTRSCATPRQAGRPRRRRADARRGRRPVADGGRAGPVHPADEGAGLPVRHRRRARRRARSPRPPPGRKTGCAGAAGRGGPTVADATTGCSGFLLMLVGVLTLARGSWCCSASPAVTPARRRARTSVVGAGGRRAGHRDRPRLQRDEDHRGDGRAHRWPATTRSRCWSSTTGPTDGTRREGGVARHAQRAGGAAAERRQAERAERRHRRWPGTTCIVMVDGDTVFEPDTVRKLVQPFADPAVGAVAGNVKVGNRDEHHRPLAAHRVRDRVQPRPPACTTRCGCMPTVPGRGRRRSAAGAAGGRAACQQRHARRGHRPDDGDRPGRLARRLRGDRTRLDRGARHAWRSCGGSATGGATAPCRRCGSTAGRCVEHGPRGQVGRRGLPLVAAVPRSSCRSLAPLVDVFFLYGLVFADPALTLLLGAGMLGVQLLTAILRVPARARAAATCCGCSPRSSRLPAADVLRAHPVGRERGERRARCAGSG